MARVPDGGHVDPFRGLGLPRIPGLSELVDVLQKQTEALAQLPRTLADLNSAVRELITATRVATETITSAQRTAERLEGLVDESRLPEGDELIADIERFLREGGSDEDPEGGGGSRLH